MSKRNLSKNGKFPQSSAKNTTVLHQSPYGLRSLGQKYAACNDIEPEVQLSKALRTSSHSFSTKTIKLKSQAEFAPLSPKQNMGEKPCFTPMSRKLGSVESTAIKYDLATPERSGVKFDTILTSMAIKAIQSTPVQKKVICKITESAAPYDIIAHTVNVHNIMKQHINADIAKQVIKFNIKLNIKFCIPYLLAEQEIVLYRSGATSSKMRSLGTYEQIADRLTCLKKTFTISDKEVAESIFDIMRHNPIRVLAKVSEKISHEVQERAIKLLVDVYYLLCSLEPHRNPSALITNPMFLDLVTEGKFLIKDMKNVMPMSITGAQRASRGIGEVFGKPFIGGFEPMDSSSTQIDDINSEGISALLSRTSTLVIKWLKSKDITVGLKEKIGDIKLKQIIVVIKDALTDWYGVALKEFPITSDDPQAKPIEDLHDLVKASASNLLGNFNEAIVE